MSLTDEKRFGRPIFIDFEALLNSVEENPRQTSRELVEKFDCDHATLVRHLNKFGKVSKNGIWVPHKLFPGSKTQRSTISLSLLSRSKNTTFLKRIFMGDEKWVSYINFRQKCQWLDSGQVTQPTPKSDFHQKNNNVMYMMEYGWFSVF